MNWKNLLALGLFGAALAGAGCKPPAAPTSETKPLPKLGEHEDEGGHEAGPHGGTIVEFGKYHGEFCMDHKKKQATYYIYDGKIKNLVPLAVESFTLSIKSPAFTVELKAEPEATDPKGKSSKFVGTHENFGKEQPFEGTVSGKIDGKPYSGDFKEEEHADHKKSVGPESKGESKEASIYLKPGGIYTEADIKANGNTTVSAKYKGLKVSHDIKPMTGDKLCPVTLTKSNEKLTWVIGGKSYEFCCPPCVEEFVELAKSNPGEIKAPESYIKK